jgi:hypothetical protein
MIIKKLTRSLPVLAVSTCLLLSTGVAKALQLPSSITIDGQKMGVMTPYPQGIPAVHPMVTAAPISAADLLDRTVHSGWAWGVFIVLVIGMLVWLLRKLFAEHGVGGRS